MIRISFGRGLCLALAVLATSATPSYAAPVSFTDDFSNGVLTPLLEDISGVFTESGGVISNSSGQRKFVRTDGSDYNTAGFTFEIDINLFSTNEIAFIGFGPGTPDPSAVDEPFGATFRIHSSNLASGRLDVGSNTFAGAGYESVAILGNVGNGTHRSRISYDGLDTLTFGYDQNFSGSFAADFSSTVSLASLSFDASNSHLFFGTTGLSGTTFDNLSVSVVATPLPGALILFGSGLVCLLGIRKHYT